MGEMNMSESILRKELSREIKDGKEYVVNEFLKLQVPLEVEEAINWIFDDYEYAQDHGVYYNYDDDISLIDIDNMLECLEDKIQDAIDEEEDYDKEKLVKEFFVKYKGFKIWM